MQLRIFFSLFSKSRFLIIGLGVLLLFISPLRIFDQYQMYTMFGEIIEDSPATSWFVASTDGESDEYYHSILLMKLDDDNKAEFRNLYVTHELHAELSQYEKLEIIESAYPEYGPFAARDERLITSLWDVLFFILLIPIQLIIVFIGFNIPMFSDLLEEYLERLSPST